MQDSAGTAIALTVGGNNGSTTYAGSLSGSGSLITTGAGTLTLTGSNTCNGGVTVSSGGLAVASTGSLTTPSGKNLYIGYASPAALTIQDSASVNVGGELDVNYQNTLAIGLDAHAPVRLAHCCRANDHRPGGHADRTRATPTRPSTRPAASATLSGPLTVGYNGTARVCWTSTAGTLNANGGLVVGDGATAARATAA